MAFGRLPNDTGVRNCPCSRCILLPKTCNSDEKSEGGQTSDLQDIEGLMTTKNAPPIIAEDDDCLWITHEDMLDHLKEAHKVSLEEFHELEPHHILGKEAFLSAWRKDLAWEHDDLHEAEPLLKPAHRKPLRICGWRPLSESMHPELESDFNKTFLLLKPARMRPTPTEARELLHNLRQTMRWIEAGRAEEILNVLIELLEQLPQITAPIRAARSNVET